MKQILLFILPVITIVVSAFVLFGFFQINFQEERLREDLQRRVEAISESIEFTAVHALIHNDSASAKKLVGSFERRQRTQGCILYDRNGAVMAATPKIAYMQTTDALLLKHLIKRKQSLGRYVQKNGTEFYAFLFPIIADSGEGLGIAEVMQETADIHMRTGDAWKDVSVFLVVLSIVLAVITMLLQKHVFVEPVVKLTQWFRAFHNNPREASAPLPASGMLQQLAEEVEQVALDLHIAKKIVTEGAGNRIISAEAWTEERLQDVVQSRLRDNTLFVVSNREPYLHVSDAGGRIKCIKPASGVVTAIDPMLKACGGTWLAHGSTKEDWKVVNAKNKLGVPPEDIRYILKRVKLTKQEEEGYYYGFANEGLWPLCHLTHTRPTFREQDWNMYRQVNMKFAQELIAELPPNPIVFVQDYHFTLLPKMIKEARPDAICAMFWHIPWPNAEVFETCPYSTEILDGLLGCDLIGFHLQAHCNNFLETAGRLLESRIDSERFSVVRNSAETFVKPFPISINPEEAKKLTVDSSDEIEAIKSELELEGKFVAVGVERVDYTKGLIERMHAIDRFLEKYPEYRGRFVFIQMAAPSRTHIKRYHDFLSEVEETVERINWKYSDGNWKPIIFRKKQFSPEEIYPYYALADLCIVSSLHDGMNLVAKEYVASKLDNKGALILSKFAGASRELSDAIIINPYATDEFSEAIRTAIEMPVSEKTERMIKMRKNVADNNVYRWAGNIITEIVKIKSQVRNEVSVL